MNDDQGSSETASPKKLEHYAGSQENPPAQFNVREDQADERTAHKHQPTIVGIGASAGGLSALKIFFSHVPSDSNLAFVVVVHLSPKHESHLSDLLQPYVNMPVEQVTDTISIEADHVYVIPPNANLSAIDTHLRLSRLEEERRKRAPIDHFFRTLAATHDGNGVGVILTGTGSDGTLGIKDVKAKGGLIIVQDPNEAEFDGMPQSAIATGLVDWILPLANIPDAIIQYDRTEPKVSTPEHDGDESIEPIDGNEQSYLQKIFAQLRARTDRDFSRYKQSTILRRISRRMQLNYIADLPTYLEKLRSDSEEVKALADDCLITVTNFFRDTEVFERLEKDVIPRLFRNKRPKDAVRVWSVGCATGEEAYSLAMLLAEESARHEAPPRIQIFASDLHKRSLERGREGLYSGDIETDVTPDRLRRFFQKENGGYRVQKDIRDLVVFSPHNLLGDPPFSRIDIIACRNLLIYLQRHAQRDVVELFHYSLNPEGTLVLGSAEIIDPIDLFRIEDKKLCFYRKRNVPAPEPRLPVFPLLRPRQHNPEATTAVNSTEPPPYGQLHQKLLELYAPPSILVSPDDKVVHLSENAGRYLVPPGGEVTTTAYKLVREELRLELRTLLQAARQSRMATDSQPISVRFNGHARPVVMHVRPALHPDQEGFRLVIFEEREWSMAETVQAHARLDPVSDPDNSHTPELEKELAVARQRAQAFVEEYETSREEMQASAEEMQSTNEELRSTMEELETSKEELQSINEELQTVNQENRHKVEELAQLSSDLQNLLTATEIATLFLDRELRILRFTPKLAELFNIRVQDRGRPISDLTHRLGATDLRADAEVVLSRLIPVEREVRDEVGHWFLTRVLPYRSTEDRILGVVITFVDITARRNAQETLRLSEERLRALVTATSYSIYRMSPDWTEMRQLQGQGFLLDTTEPSTRWLEKYILPDDQPQVVAAIQQAIRSRSMFELEHRIRRLDGSGGWTLSRAVPLLDADGEVTEWFAAASDVTARKEAEARQIFLLQLSDALRPLVHTAEIQSVACRLLGEHLGAQRAYYAEIHEAEAFAVVEQDYVSGGLPSVARRYALSDFGWMMPLYKQGRTIVVPDVKTSPLVPDSDRGVMIDALVVAWIAVPLIKNGELAGTLCLAEGESREWTQTEIELTQETAERIWAAIERTRAETALRVSEEKYRSLFERMAQGYAEAEFVRDDQGLVVDHRYLELNPTFERLTGVSVSSARGQLAGDVLPGLEFWWTETLDRIVRQGKPERIEHEVASVGRWYEAWVYPGREDRFTVLYEDITEQKRAEAALRESEARARELVANLPGGAAFVVDHNLRYQLAGGEALGEAGFSAGAFDGCRLDEVLPPELVEEYTPHFRKVLAGETFAREHEAHGRVYLSRGVPLRNDGGEVYAALAVSYDITDRKRAEAALRESEERQRTLLEGMPQLVWRSHDHGSWTWASPQWRRFTGQSQEQSTGHGWLNALHPDDQEPTRRAWAAADGQQQLDVEYRVRRASDGLYLWHHTRALPVRNQEGQVLEWLGTSTDIEQLKQAEAARREAEEKFRLFAENVHEYALVQTDSVGSITGWNPGAQRLFGYDSEEMQGQNFSVLFTPEDYAVGVFRQELADVASGQRNEDARWMVRQDGSRFWARWISEPIYDQNGRFRGVAKIMRDETERERVEVFTRQSLTEKQELLKEVHHRVKNNLQVIVSLLNMQARQIQDERVLALFQETRNRVLAISTIHESLYRVESFANIALAEYARQLVPGLVRFYGLEQRVQVTILGDGATLELERAVPCGMLLNELVSNACKHAFPSPRTGNITISFEPDRNYIQLVVADTGQGLPDGFDYQKASSLGLKLVHGLVRQLRGILQIESESGTTVRVRFPTTGVDEEI